MDESIEDRVDDRAITEIRMPLVDGRLRKAMIDREHTLSITRQAEALGISRGSVYYLPRPVSDADLKLMRRIDELHLEYPFAGARVLRDLLRTEGYKAGRTSAR